MLVRAATDAILIGADHSGAQFVENLKGCLVTREPELPLELDGRHAGGLAGEQVGGPEPDEQRRVAALHDRADGQSCLTPAFAACQHARAGRNAERFASHTTVRTDEAVSPARGWPLAFLRSRRGGVTHTFWCSIMIGDLRLRNYATKLAH